MAAVFPLDTTKPWTFNGVTYEYDADDDRWFVVSTIATDQVVDSINSNQSDIDVLNTIIDQEIENRTALLDVAAAKNNQQDSDIAELDARVDALAALSGRLEFKGSYTYVALKTTAGCQAEYEQCLRDAQDADDIIAARSQCTRDLSDCTNSIGEPLADTTFSTTGTDDVGGPSLLFQEQESITITDVSIEGSSFDWHNVLEIGDFIELVETTDNDIILYEVIADPITKNGSEEIRIKYIKSENLGDGQFNYDEVYLIRAFRAKQGLDIIAADERYIQKPYSVYFEDNAVNISPIAPDGELKNGELWYDTDSLELFIYNNNAWTASARPPTSDITIKGVINDVDELQNQAHETVVRVNSLISDLMLENNIYYSDNAPTGDITGTLRNGDLWIDSDDLTIKFYSQGAWINPDRQVGGDYLETTGGEMTGDLEIMGGPEVGGANIYLWNNGFTRYGWGNTPTELYGGYVFMRDEDNFEIGTYDNKDLKLKAGSIFIDGQLEILNTDDTNHEGFTIYGTTKDGVPGNLLQAYHNSGSLPDAVNYSGVISSNTNIVNKQYVDDSVAEDQWEWHSKNQGDDSIYIKNTIHWTYIDTNTIKLNISQHSLQGRSWKYPNTSHEAVEFPISITGIVSGSTVPVLSGKTSSIRSLAYQGSKYFQIFVPIDNQFIWAPTAVPNLASVKVKIHGYL